MTPWTVARQVPLSTGFPRQEFWSGLPFPPLGDLPDPGITLRTPLSPELAGQFFTTEPPRKPIHTWGHFKHTEPVFPRGRVDKEPPAKAGDKRSTSGPWSGRIPQAVGRRDYWARVLQPLKPCAHSKRTSEPRSEKPAAARRAAPARCNWREPSAHREDPEQPHERKLTTEDRAGGRQGKTPFRYMYSFFIPYA